MVHYNTKRKLRTIFLIFFSWIFLSLCATKVIYDAVFARYDPEPSQNAAIYAALLSAREATDFPCAEQTLRGYLYGGTRDTLIVLCPGLNATADDFLPQIQSLTDYGWAVFAFDPTGCGQSGGSSAVGYPQAVRDLSAALDYLQAQNFFGYERYALFGHSRGAYAACGVLREYSPSALIAVSGANSAMEGVLAPSVEAVGALAYANYPFLWLYQATLFDADAVNLDASEELARANIPALVVHGSRDESVPAEEFSIFSHRDRFSASVLLLGDAGHTDLLFDRDGAARGDLMAQIHAFLLQYCG